MHCSNNNFRGKCVFHHAKHLNVPRVDIISDFNYLNKKILKMNHFFLFGVTNVECFLDRAENPHHVCVCVRSRLISQFVCISQICICISERGHTHTHIYISELISRGAGEGCFTAKAVFWSVPSLLQLLHSLSGFEGAHSCLESPVRCFWITQSSSLSAKLTLASPTGLDSESLCDTRETHITVQPSSLTTDSLLKSTWNALRNTFDYDNMSETGDASWKAFSFQFDERLWTQTLFHAL